MDEFLLTDLLSPAVLPSDPFLSVSGVTEPITADELLAMTISVPTLGTNQSHKVEFVEVDLQEIHH